MPRKITKTAQIIYLIQYFLIRMLYLLIKLVPMKISAKIFGFVGVLIGPFISANKTANDNIKLAMPDANKPKRNEIVRGVWNNLGMFIGEFFHVHSLDKDSIKKYVTLSPESQENLEKIKNSKKGTIIFSAHYGNWEIGLQNFRLSGLEVGTVYRPLNNRLVDKFTAEMRKVKMIPKGSKGAKEMVKMLKKGGVIIILLDQKISQGIKVPFFGKDVKTSAAAATLALKYGFNLVPARTIRKGKTSEFEVEIGKPLKYRKTDSISNDTKKIMTKINKIIEDWVREYPEQWFWVHNRWR